jgi:hypothetical protein
MGLKNMGIHFCKKKYFLNPPGQCGFRQAYVEPDNLEKRLKGDLEDPSSMDS